MGRSPRRLAADADSIILTNLLIATIIAITWYLADSIYLRFVVLFIGIMNALYAIWDIFLDGIKYSTEQSDATLMVRMLSERRRESGRILEPGLMEQGKKAHSSRCTWILNLLVLLLMSAGYSVVWLTCQVTALLLAVVRALYWHKETIAEQAVESRRFLPSPNRYGPADLVDQASDSISGLF